VPTLQSVLAINIELLAPEEREGMALAEEIYRHAGTPVDAWQLPQVIEQIPASLGEFGPANFG
jgi:hypothetical protein